MKRFMTYFAMTALALLTACATTPPSLPLTNGQITPAAGQGVAIIALTGQSTNVDMSSVSLGITGAAAPITLSAQLGADYIQSPGSAANIPGKVFALPLAAGDYQVSQAKGMYVVVGSHSGETLYVNLPIQAPFSIKAGEVVYLGSVNMMLNFESSMAITQNAARDLFDLKARDGVTDQSNIIQRPLKNLAPAKVY